MAQWLSVLPAVIFGLALGLGNRTGRSLGRSFSWGLGLLLLATAVALAARGLGWGAVALPFWLAATLLLICWAIVTPPGRWSDLAARSALGVYLVHPLVASVLRRLTGLPEGTLTFFGLTAAGSFGLAVLIWRRRPAPAHPAPA